MVFNPRCECMDRQALEALQLERLKQTIDRVQSVPFYRERLRAAGVDSRGVGSLQDIGSIPFTVKDDLRENYPYGLFAVPMRQIARVHASSGTTGRQTVVGYTKDDLAMWAEIVARIIVAGGGTQDDIAQIAFGYGLFTGAFGLHGGMERVGAAVIPVSSGNTERQIRIMQDFGSTVLISTPSYALYMVEVAESMGVDTAALPLRIGLFGAEGHTEEMRRELERRWHITATENYGLSEIIGPGVSGECLHKCGLHIAEDHFLCEIIDPDSGAVLREGEEGELVITTITKEGMPLLRYRTRDITRITCEPCACGRTSARMDKVKGRSDDMLIIRGVNVFPSQIEAVLVAMEEVGPNYEIIVRKQGYLNALEVLVEVNDGQLLERYSELETLREKVRGNIRSVLNIDVKVSLVEPASLKRFEGKAKRVVDLRNE